MRVAISTFLLSSACLISNVSSSLTHIIPFTSVCKYHQEFGTSNYCNCESSGPCSNPNDIGVSTCCDLSDLTTGCESNEVMESFIGQEVYLSGTCGNDFTCGIRRQLYQYLCCRCPTGYIPTTDPTGTNQQNCPSMLVTCAGCVDADEELQNVGGVLGCRKRVLSPSNTTTSLISPPITTSSSTTTRAPTTTSKPTTRTTTTTKKTTTKTTTTTCSTHPTTIPGAPPDPLQPKTGDGSGPWRSQKPTLGDHAAFLSFRAMARAADTIGLHHAALNMDHYLNNKGTTFTNAPEDLIHDIPSFASSVHSLLQQQASLAFKSSIAGGKGSTKSFQSKWNGFYATEAKSKDWFFAIGGFSRYRRRDIDIRIDVIKDDFELCFQLYNDDRSEQSKGNSNKS